MNSSNVNAFNDGETSIMRAAWNNDYQTAESLIKSGANIYLRDKFGKSALYWVGNINNVSIDLVSVFIEKVASDCGHDKEKIIKKLIGEKWPLQKVVLIGDVEMTKIALERHYKRYINALDFASQTALCVAVQNIDVDNVKLLLKYKANVSERIPLPSVYTYDDDCPKIASKKLEILEILLARTCNIHFRDIETLLMKANKCTIELFLKYNKNITAYDLQGNTTLHALAVNKHLSVIEMLYDKTLNVDVRNRDGETPLMMAAKFGNANGVKFLLDEGADIEAIDNTQHTAFCFAVDNYTDNEGQYEQCLHLLLERGANVQIVWQNENGNLYTIFDLVPEKRKFPAIMITIAHLALQEFKGAPITELICSRIDSQDSLKFYFQFCKQQLNVKVYESLTLFDLLTETDQQLERYVRNSEARKKIQNYIHELESDFYYYFCSVLRKRFSKTIHHVVAKRESGQIIGKIMRMNYERFPLIADNVICYLETRDMDTLIDTYI